MTYANCHKCLCRTCTNTACAAKECKLCENLSYGFEAPCGYPNVACRKYKPHDEPDAKCICCGATVPPGSAYCPNCLVASLKQ